MAKVTGANGSTVNLTANIILMDLDVGVWGARKALTPQDLGKDPDDIPEEFYLGHKALIPRAALKPARTFEGRGRAILEKCGYVFPIGQTRAIPVGVIEEVEVELAKVRADFEEWLDEEFLPKYQTYLDAYVAKFGEENRRLFPTRDAVRSKFTFDWVCVTISVPKGNDDNALKVRKRIESWVDQVAEEYQTAAAQVFEVVAERLERGGPISDRTFDRMKKAVNRLRSINFLDFEQVESALKDAQKLLETYTADGIKTDVDAKAAMQKALGKIVTEIKDASLEEVTTAYKRKLRI